MAHFWLALVWAAYYGFAKVFCRPVNRAEILRGYDAFRSNARTEAAKLLEEFAGQEHAEMMMMDPARSFVPSVLLEETGWCKQLSQRSKTSVSPGVANVKLPHADPHRSSTDATVNIDESGQPWAACPRVICSATPYYGHKGASDETNFQPSTTLGDLKRVSDLTELGLNVNFNKKAYEEFQICNGLFFSSSGAGRSDPACVIDHLDESSKSIRTMDTRRLRPLHPKLKIALVLASKFASSEQKRKWLKKLLHSLSLRLVWHVAEAFSEMNVTMLEANVGEALNTIALKDKQLIRPLEDLIRFATVCSTYDEYPERSLQDSAQYPSPDSSEYKDYPIYIYLRETGADVSFPKDVPKDWQPRVYDGNRSTRRAYGEHNGPDFFGNPKMQIYNSWHNLWVLNLIMYDAGSMWQWSQHLSANTFFFKPWRVTRVVTLRLSEAGHLRYDDLTSRFRVDPSSPPKEEDFATCPRHLTDLGFFDKVNAPYGRVTAQWNKQTSVLPGEQRENCPLVEAKVPCPPIVHPDKCGNDATYIRAVEGPWLYRLERDSKGIDDAQSDYVDIIWSARGTAFPKLWLLNTMSETTIDPELTQSGKIHSGFLFLFQKGAKDVIAEDIQEVANKIHSTGKRKVVLFTGHSLGGAVAQLAAWYYANQSRDLLQSGLLQIRCVTFGTPAWGDEKAYQEFMATGVLIHDVATNVDPVTTLNGEPEIGHGLQWRKPFHYRIMLDDMAKVVVASESPMEPDFYGQLWTRKELHTGNFLKRMFEAGYGSALAAPLLRDPPIAYSTHAVRVALLEAQRRMRWVMNRIRLESGNLSPLDAAE